MRPQTSLGRSRALAGAVALPALLLMALLMSLRVSQALPQAAASSPPGNVLRIQDAEPGTLDPALAEFGTENRIVAQVFEGLVRLDENFTPQPALASAWSYSPNASIYTFTLREAYFANGRPVLAADIVNSIVRALSPTINNGGQAPFASMLYDIQGAEAYNSGGTVQLPTGVQALDAVTVRFQLVRTVPPPVFLNKLALPVAKIIPLEEVVAGGAEWWRDPAHCVGTGPFKLAEWITSSHISLTANLQHHAGPPPLSGIRVCFITDTNAALDAYRTGELDVLPLNVTDVPTVTADPLLATDLITGPGMCIFYVTMDNQRSPFTGAAGIKLRQAFNHAVSKTDLISAALNNIGAPIQGLLPPAMYGYDPDLQGLDYDLALATQRLSESGYTGTPQIVLRHGATRVAQAANLQSQLLNNLSVSISLTMTASNYQMRLWAWCPDYADPENILPLLLRTGAVQNLTHYRES